MTNTPIERQCLYCKNKQWLGRFGNIRCKSPDSKVKDNVNARLSNSSDAELDAHLTQARKIRGMPPAVVSPKEVYPDKFSFKAKTINCQNFEETTHVYLENVSVLRETQA